MFEMDYTLRYGDLNRNGNVRLGAILDILQDIAGRHSSSVGYSYDVLYEKSIAWLMQGWRVKTISALDYDYPVRVKTGIMNVKRFTSERKYEIWQNGELKLIATADWFTVDITKLKPILVPQEILVAYDTVTEESNDLPFIKLRPEIDTEFIKEAKVEDRDLDQNQHVNNAKSAEILSDGLYDSSIPSEIRITYRKAVMPENKMLICYTKQDDGYYLELKNENNEPCVLMQLILF